MRLETINHSFIPRSAHWGLPNRWTGVTLHAMLVSVILLAAEMFDNPSLTLMLGGALSIPIYITIGLMEARRAPLWFTPLSFYFFWYSVGLGISAIYIGIIVSTASFINFSPPKVPPKDVAMGYVIFMLGSFALHLGLQLFRPTGRSDSGVFEPEVHERRLAGLVILWIVGLWSSWSPALIIPLGAPGRIFQWASLAALSTFVLTPRESFRLSRLIFNTFLLIGTAGLCTVNLMSYSKAYIMYSFFPVLWLFIMRPSLRRWIPLLGLALTVFYLFIVAPIVITARLTPLQPGESPAEHIMTVFDSWRQGDLAESDSYTLSERADQFLMRQFDPIAVGYIYGEVKTYGLQLGATMTYIAYAFIPRILWPEKPTVTRGAWFATYVGFAPSEEEATMSLGISAIGELYWNYSILGVLAGMFSIGCLLSGLWRLAGDDPRQSPLCMLLYVIIMFNMVNMSEAVTTFVSIVVTFLTFKTAFMVVNMLRRPVRRAHVVIAA